MATKKPFYEQYNRKVSKSPPEYLSDYASDCWKNIVPFLDSTKKVERIDSYLIELYCVQYGIYREAYEVVKKNGVQTPIYKTVQNQMGEIVGEDFVGYKKNPAVDIMKNAITQINAIGISIGLSPKGRSELMNIAGESKEETSMAEKMKEFLGK